MATVVVVHDIADNNDRGVHGLKLHVRLAMEIVYYHRCNVLFQNKRNCVVQSAF